MKKTNITTLLKNISSRMDTNIRKVEVENIPEPDTVNLQGFASYSLDDKIHLVAMLNTCKLDDQFYRTSEQQLVDLQMLVDTVGKEDPLFLAQAIVYSRCMAGGLRAINAVAAAMAAPYFTGREFAKRFYGSFDKKGSVTGTHHGGCIYRADDMIAIKNAYKALYGHAMSNAMKKGFASVVEHLDEYQIAKYQKDVRDIVNLVHPKNCNAQDVINRIMNGETVVAQIWESANSYTGQKVAEAVRSGEIAQKNAQEVLDAAKNENWKQLLIWDKLGILAALRNVRNIIKCADDETISRLCAFLTDPNVIKKSLVNPIQIDLAYESIKQDFDLNPTYRKEVGEALTKAYNNAIPNLAKLMPGKTLVVLDVSGSMGKNALMNNTSITDSCIRKGALIAATIAKGTGADIMEFSSNAKYHYYDKNDSLFSLVEQLCSIHGMTKLYTVFEKLTYDHEYYDRIIIISDNEVNGTIDTNYWYAQYVKQVCSPYIYNIDLCAYKAAPLKGDKVRYYAGYSFAMFEDIASTEFNPADHMDKIRNIKI